jgi:hypothetical protein
MCISPTLYTQPFFRHPPYQTPLHSLSAYFPIGFKLEIVYNEGVPNFFGKYLNTCGREFLMNNDTNPWNDNAEKATSKLATVTEDTLMGVPRQKRKYEKRAKRGRPRLAKNKTLNPKQEAYCRYRVEKRMNKASAYRMAYGNEASSARDTYVYAYNLERKPHIIERMRQLLEDRAAIAKFYGGPEEALASWHNILQMATEAGDIKSIIRAQENIDKITGADKANLMNDEVAKTMFLSMHGAESKDEFQEQITKVLMQLQDKEHKVKPKGVKFGEEGSFRGVKIVEEATLDEE